MTPFLPSKGNFRRNNRLEQRSHVFDTDQESEITKLPNLQTNSSTINITSSVRIKRKNKKI